MDKKYSDNYIFAAIGGSPAVFSEIFKYDGIESKIFPFSLFSVPEDINDYFKKLNFTRENINKTNKIFIFNDFTVSGKTLKSFEKYVKQAKLMPQKSQFLSTQKLILEADKKILNKAFGQKDIDFLIQRYFYNSAIKDYTISPEMYDLSGRCYKYVDKISTNFNWQPTTKLLQFAIIDDFVQQGKISV